MSKRAPHIKKFKKKHHLPRFKLAMIFAILVFLIMLITMLLVASGMLIMVRLGYFRETRLFALPLIIFATASLMVGIVLALLVSHRPLAPIRTVINATEKIAKGDYSVRINLKGPNEFKHLGHTFNHMAEELSSVEMLRNDFVNNFSHEFKTPIVSIRGFAKMLKREDLSPDEKNEYLDIIINESERLTELSTNVLNLSKLEQQTIVTNKIHYNISEQIRQVIALLNNKIEAKKLLFDFDCKEVYLNGNEELLKQVWINLIDNAVKFSPESGSISIIIITTEKTCDISIINDGEHLSNESIPHFFDKFYQGNTSHSEKGNGLGLTIAKRIIKLHEGRINSVLTSEGRFEIQTSLPL